jgi:hypothetical protein
MYTGALPGASVALRYQNGSLLASGTTGSNGIVTFVPSEWPFNTTLFFTASYPGYFSGSGHFYTGTGGAKGTSVTLSKGDFGMAPIRRGHATVYPDGRVGSNAPGQVKAYAAWLGWEYPYLPISGWLGGGINLRGELRTDFSSYSFSRRYMNPSGNDTSGYDSVNVTAVPKQVLSTSCAVRVYGKAGAPTNREKHANVRYTVQLQPR